MAAHNDFYTWQSLATFAGTTAATNAVTNGLCRVIPGLKRIAALGLVLAIVFCVMTAVVDVSTGQVDFAKPFATYFIAVVNGFFVFASAAGLSAGGANLARGAPNRRTTTRGGPVSRGPGDASDVFPAEAPGFFRRWL